VSICVDKKDEPKNDNGKAIGIDWNCRDNVFLTLSDGTKVKCPRFLREKEKQLAHYQKLLSKKFVKGKPEQSKNYLKAKYKVAKLHEKVSWQRQDWLHKLSYNLAQKYQYVIVEDINLQAMSQMHHGKAVSDQGFGMLRNMIAYKTTLVKVSAKNTSKTCHTCGYINPKVVLGVEQWKCPVCSSEHDRDINAALNILNKGVTSLGIVGRERAESTNACGEPRSSAKQEVCSTIESISDS
jgi:putative transposase